MVIDENEQIIYTDESSNLITIIVTGRELPYDNTKILEYGDYGCYVFALNVYAKKKSKAALLPYYKKPFRFRGTYYQNTSKINGNVDNDTTFSVGGTIDLTDIAVGEIKCIDTKVFYIRDVRDPFSWIGGSQKPITGDFDVFFEIGSDRIKSNNVHIAYKEKKPYASISVSNTKQHQCDVCAYVSYIDEKLKHPYDEIHYEIYLNTSRTPIIQGTTSQSRSDPLKIEQTIALPKSNENYTVSVVAYFNYWNSKETLQSCAFHTLPIYISSFDLSDVVVNENESVSVVPNAVLPSDHDIGLYTMQSDNKALATFSGKILYGKQKGTGTYTAYAQDGGGASTTAQFTVKRYASDIVLNRYELRIAPGETFQISTTVLPTGSTDDEEGTTAKKMYTSSNPAICTVSETGLITALAASEEDSAVQAAQETENGDIGDIETEEDVGAGAAKECTITVTLISERPNKSISKTINVTVTDAIQWTTLQVPDFVTWMWLDDYVDNLKILKEHINLYIQKNQLSIGEIEELEQVETYDHEATPIAKIGTVLDQLERNITTIYGKMETINKAITKKYYGSVSWTSGTKDVRSYVKRWVDFANDCYAWLLFN
ncbi:MAG: hypothetical protein PUB99_09700 [Oscillospiraceae bacterium]|nr:hypothetical protein [Oscillospiraceae bacterium]